MIRKQIYLTKEEQDGIDVIAKTSGMKQSEVIREAIDEYLVKVKPEDKLTKLRKAKGIWKERDDIDFAEIRESFDRF